MQRLEILDGMRGYFLVFMMLNHLTFAGGYLLVKINHSELGFVQDAQGFVFLSGMLVGMVYARRMLRDGYDAGARLIRKRAFEIYKYAAGSLLAIMALGFVLTHSGTYWEPWLWELAEHDPYYAVASLVLLYQPTYMDILPQYIIYMLFAPPLVWLSMTGRWAWVVGSSFLLWMMVQIGLHLPIAAGMRVVLARIHDGDLLRSAFNVLAWQIVFMTGLVLGSLTSTQKIDWQKLFARAEARAIAAVSFALVMCFMGYRLGFTFGIIPEDMAQRFRRLDNRTEFSLVYLVNFAALGYLVTWLLIAGRTASNRVLRGAGAILRWVFSLSFLRLIGRHSLQVYVWHVIVIYLLKAVEFHYGPYTELTKTLIAIAAVASMAVPALYREREKLLPRTGK